MKIVIITLRWIARILSLVWAGFILLTMLGERHVPPFFHLTMLSLSLWLLFIAVFSPLAAWRYELPASIVSLVAFAGFYSIILPRGSIFFLFTLAPLMFLLARMLSRLAK